MNRVTEGFLTLKDCSLIDVSDYSVWFEKLQKFKQNNPDIFESLIFSAYEDLTYEENFPWAFEILRREGIIEDTGRIVDLAKQVLLNSVVENKAGTSFFCNRYIMMDRRLATVPLICSDTKAQFDSDNESDFSFQKEPVAPDRMRKHILQIRENNPIVFKQLVVIAFSENKLSWEKHLNKNPIVCDLIDCNGKMDPLARKIICEIFEDDPKEDVSLIQYIDEEDSFVGSLNR